MKFNGTIVTIYGVLVMVGGLIGYLTAGSLISLVTGIIFGALLFASGLGLFKTNRFAFFTALSVTAVLSLFFSYRFYLTGVVMPSGMMSGISLLIFLLLITTRKLP